MSPKKATKELSLKSGFLIKRKAESAPNPNSQARVSNEKYTNWGALLINTRFSEKLARVKIDINMRIPGVPNRKEVKSKIGVKK